MAEQMSPSDVELLIYNVLDKKLDAIKKAAQNGHPTTRFGKVIQNNTSVIIAIFSATWWVSGMIMRLDNKVTEAIPKEFLAVNDRITREFLDLNDRVNKDFGILEAKFKEALMYELRSRDEAQKNNEATRNYLLAGLQKKDEELTRKVEGIIQVCCPKGVPIGMINGESPTYVQSCGQEDKS